MRPLELRVRNFRSYFGDDSVFDFRERGLIGIVGPIGAGKSSLLDAIAFALFGRTPTVAASTKSLIHQRADSAAVSLRFAVDSETWEVTRSLRRKGQSVHGLVKLTEDSPDAARLETIVLEAEVNARVAELLGLEFDGFSRSIMLAQGRFAEFLRSRPAERDKVLKGVFGHDRIDIMRAEAKARAAAEAAREAAFGVRLEAADALGSRIAVSKEQLAIDEARLEVLRKAEAKFVDHQERLEATTRVVSHAATKLAELEPLAGRLPAVDVVAEVVKTSQNASEVRHRLGEALDTAQAQLGAADAALALLDPPELRRRIDEASRLEATRDQIELQRQAAAEMLAAKRASAAQVAKTLLVTEERLTAASARVAEATSAVAEALVEHDSAALALHDAQHMDMAGTLRERLEVGADCPVCEQPVVLIPSMASAPPTDTAATRLGEAVEAVASGRRLLEAATRAATESRSEVVVGRAALKAVDEETATQSKLQAKAEAEVLRVGAALTELCGEESVGTLRSSLDTAELAVAETRKKVDLARSEHDEAIRAAQDADKELGAMRLSLAELATRLSVELDPGENGPAVAESVRHVRNVLADTVETLTTAKTAAEHEQAEIVAADRQLREELAIDGEFATLMAEAVAGTDLRRQQIEADEQMLAESDDLRAARAVAVKQRTVYESLAGELTDSKFVRYLLDEEKRDLASLGSEHFERLSSGRYRFSADGDFHVLDLTSADAMRKADSLSGGETFLASLALALALAEMVARTGGRLDAFFLDEGFGSLDAEHLDLAMEGIEQLASGSADRLVLVVSHVPDMRERIEDLIELERDPVTGDTIVVHG